MYQLVLTISYTCICTMSRKKIRIHTYEYDSLQFRLYELVYLVRKNLRIRTHEYVCSFRCHEFVYFRRFKITNSHT